MRIGWEIERIVEDSLGHHPHRDGMVSAHWFAEFMRQRAMDINSETKDLL
jgi:hypothetical protein